MAELTPNTPSRPREIDIFNHHTNGNKLKTLAIALGIALVVITISYFLIKIFSTYTITVIADGGTVYGEELAPMEYSFLERTYMPKGFKKEGYYVAGYYTDKNFKNEYTFGSRIWRSATIYVDWQPGFALQLFFDEGQGDDDRPEPDHTGINEKYLKTYYEEYVKPDTEWAVPEVINNTGNARHNGEKLFWYDKNGNLVENETFIVSENIPLYGRWFDTSADKFDITEDGTMKRYLGNCDNIVLPSTVKRFKSIDETQFRGEGWNSTIVADGSNYSVFDKVIKTLETVFINAECEELNSCLFKSCEKLKNVIFLGNKVTKIENSVFDGCESLSEIHLPTSITGIGNHAFANCSTLATVTGTENVRNLGEGAFISCGVLKNLNLNSVRTIGRLAFGGCFKLESLVLGYNSVVTTSVTVPSGNSDVSDNVLIGAVSAKIYVPALLVDNYKADSVWGVYSLNIRPIAE
jgi:hypothetical protein